MDARQQWSVLLSTLLGGVSLGADDTAWAMDRIMAGEATAAQVAGFAVALRGKGETVAEVTGLARAMFRHATEIVIPGTAADLVGTGGDRAHTVNISTMGAIVAAAAGVPMVKHGNRAASSSCGSADVLERLGVVIDLDPGRTAGIADEAGITFCFAPLFHPALRHTSAPRRELGIATVFNFLGPLTNPARPAAQAVGVSDPRMCPVVAGVLAERGTSALVFRGCDGLDELTTTGPSTVWMVRDSTVIETTLDPVDLGIARAEPDDLRGADADYNAAVARRVLAGVDDPVRDAVLLNAAAADVAYRGTGQPCVSSAGGAPSGSPPSASTLPSTPDADPGEALLTSMRDALDRCRSAIDEGRASALMNKWVETSQRLAG